MNFLELYIGITFIWSIYYVMGTIIFEYKEKTNYKKLIPIIMFFSLLVSLINIANSEIFGGIIKIILIYTLVYCYYMLIFNKNSSQTLIGSLITYLALFISETIVAIAISIIFYFLDNQSMLFLKDSIIINATITSISYVIVKMYKRKLINLVNNSNLDSKSSILIIFLILITIALLVFKIPLANWNLNIEFILTMILLLCFTLTGFFMLKQKADIQKTTSMYQKLADYADTTNSLLEDYRIATHEQKNQLLIIRSMIDEKNQELVEYVDNLLDKRMKIKYQWIGQLNYLPLSGLKGLINYKLIEMEKAKINTNISISKDISKTKLEKLLTKQKDQLYSIVGIYLDNAIQAACESKKKEISLEIYKEKKDVVFVLANTYKGNIELDKVDTYGYTTKGKNHGVGLHIVKKIIEGEAIFSQIRSLYDDYYVQELRIHLDKIKK